MDIGINLNYLEDCIYGGLSCPPPVPAGFQWNPLEYLSKFGRENVNIPLDSSRMEFLIGCQLDSTSLQEESMPVDSSGFYWIPLESRGIQCNTIKFFYFIYSLV